MAFKAENIEGQRFGMLTATKVIERIKVGRRSSYVWEWHCQCGGFVAADIYKVRSGRVMHCGCESPRMKRKEHGHACKGHVTPTYRSYQAAKSRCHNPRNIRYEAYGARGIQMCARWRESFQSFLADMGERPEGLTLERTNVDRGYEPGNCSWATLAVQNENRRQSIRVEHEGQVLSLKKFAAAVGVSYKALHQRVRVTGHEPRAAAAAMLRGPHSRV